MPLDITDPQQIESAATKAATQDGVDVVFNSAGYGMKTDFFTRSFDIGRHPAYDALVEKVMSVITDPKQMGAYSTPEQIAEVVYEAATDGKDQLGYVAGADGKALMRPACSWAMKHSARRSTAILRVAGADPRLGLLSEVLRTR